LKNSVFFFY